MGDVLDWALGTAIVALTAVITAAAVWMAIGLLRRDRRRVDDLAGVGFHSPAWPIVFGLVLLAATVAVVAGWWLTPVGIAGIITIKLLYVLMLVAYRRADRVRPHDLATRALSAHSAVAIALVVAW